MLLLNTLRWALLGVNNHLDEVAALFDVNDLLFYKTSKIFAKIECATHDIKCSTLSGVVLKHVDALITRIGYTKQQTESYINALNDDVAKQITVVSPFEPGGDAYSFLNIPTRTVPVCIRSSDKTEQIANVYGNSMVFYKHIVFTPRCSFSLSK